MDINEVKKMVLELASIEPTAANIAHYENCDYLTQNTGRDGEEYIWYMDEHVSVAVRVSDGVELTADEIEKNFC